MANDFVFRWRQPAMPQGNRPDLGNVAENYQQAMMDNRPLFMGLAPREAMEGYHPAESVYDAQRMQGYHQNVTSTPDANLTAQRMQALSQERIQQEFLAKKEQGIKSIDEAIAANNAKIAELRKQLVAITNGSEFADDMDRALAANRASAGDMSNAQTHLGRIEARANARRDNENALRIRMMDKMGDKDKEEFNDLLEIAKLRTSLEAVAKDPGLRSGLEREYNMKVSAYSKKYGHEPDLSGYEGKVNLYMDRGGYKDASEEDLAKDASVLGNYISSKKDGNFWVGTMDELRKAIKSARSQGNEDLAKSLEKIWTKDQYNVYVRDMDKEGADALKDLASLEADAAELKGEFTDKSNRKWTKKNGKWRSADYKWNGKHNGV